MQAYRNPVYNVGSLKRPQPFSASGWSQQPLAYTHSFYISKEARLSSSLAISISCFRHEKKNYLLHVCFRMGLNYTSPSCNCIIAFNFNDLPRVYRLKIPKSLTQNAMENSTCTHKHAQARTCTHAHAHARTRTHAHARTYIYMHPHACAGNFVASDKTLWTGQNWRLFT